MFHFDKSGRLLFYICNGLRRTADINRSAPYFNDIARLDRRYTFEYRSKQLDVSSVALLAHENNPDRLQENSEV